MTDKQLSDYLLHHCIAYQHFLTTPSGDRTYSPVVGGNGKGWS
ncbi:hypothetical protein [Argonema galeatum]|nr:hypothetical protein [Argonema galeatum]